MKLYMPPPAIWAIAGINDGEVNVYEAFSGRPLMRIQDPKANVPAVSLTHAPFRGFVNRQLKVIPIEKPSDLLRVKSSQLVETDWVWIGFTDGSIRLFPANPSRIRDSDRSEQFSKGELADLVFELPKYHNASIVSIVRSPCHRDEEGADLSTLTRLSTAVQYMTAAGVAGGDANREHLSLMCTASLDSSIVIWDVRKIYQTLEAMRMAKKEALGGGSSHLFHSSGSSARMSTSGRTPAFFAASVYSNETITLEGFASAGDAGGGPFCVRSSCTMVKVRPLMRLKGGVASLKSLQWISTLVTTEGYVKPRHETELTRDAEEPSAPQLVRRRHPYQLQTRFDRREEYRRSLRLSEADMCEVEEELSRLLPPITQEPVQTLRVNLIIASDNVGTVHVWNLDEELARKANDPYNDRAASVADSARHASRHRSPAASESPGRSSVGAGGGGSGGASNPSVQLSAIEGPTSTAALHKHQCDATDLSSAAGASPGPTKAKSPAPRRKRPPADGTGGATATPKRGTPSPAAKAAGAARTHGKRATTGNTEAGKPEKKKKGPAKALAGPPHPHQPLFRSSPSRHRTAVTVGGDDDDGANSTSSRAVSSARGGTSRAPMSKMQMLASQRGDPHVPVREMNRTMDGNGGSAAGEADRPGRRPLSTALPSSSSNSPRRRTPKKAVSSNAVPAAVSPRAAVSVSPSRGPVGLGEGASISPRERPRSPSLAAGVGSARISVSRRAASTESASQQRALNAYLSRASRCRIEFTGGVAINGMAVDVPPRLAITLRRIPEPEERHISLLEEPTPEELERRLLENSFEVLTEDKALFFVFQRLQLYLAVEGTVLNLRSVPLWQQRDDDQRDLFARRGELESERAVSRQQLLKETLVDGSVELTPAFSIRFRKLVLEVHSQPVSELLLDHGRGHVWVARGDGLLSLFSRHTKKMVTRVPHPCADAALGPPNQREWRAQQRELVEELTSGAPLRLEPHKECSGYEAAHFSRLIPFGQRTQLSFVLTATAAPPSAGEERLSSKARRLDSFSGFDSTSPSVLLETIANETFSPSQLEREQRRHQGPTAAAAGTPVPYALSALMQLRGSHGLAERGATTSMTAVKLDGCSDLSPHAQRREERLGALLNQLLWCRGNVDAVRRAQKAYYESLCVTIGTYVRYVIGEIGAYVSLVAAHRSYDLWRRYATLVPHRHVMRRQRHARLAKSSGAAAAMGRVVRARLAGAAFRLWFLWTVGRRSGRGDAANLTRVLEPLRREDARRVRYRTAHLFQHFLQTQQRCSSFNAWRAWAHAKRGEALAAPQRQRQQAQRHESRLGRDSLSPVTGTSVSSTPPTKADTVARGAAVKKVSPGGGSYPADSPHATSPLVRTFTRGYHTSSTPPYRGDHSAPDTDGRSRSDGRDKKREEEEGSERDAEEREAAALTSDGVEGEEQAALLQANPFLVDFLEMLHLLYWARPAIILFRESEDFAESVLDESWMSIVESAEGAADTDDPRDRRDAVLSIGLLPLLRGLLSTAEDVLPDLHETRVANEVLSMFDGIQLCMDYVAADTEDPLPVLEQEDPTAVARQLDRVALPEHRYMRDLAAHVFRAAKTAEHRKTMKDIVSEREHFDAFIAFVEERRLHPRSQASLSLS